MLKSQILIWGFFQKKTQIFFFNYYQNGYTYRYNCGVYTPISDSKWLGEDYDDMEQDDLYNTEEDEASMEEARRKNDEEMGHKEERDGARKSSSSLKMHF